jgi:asparagine synthase (glutamine-hydrolysing)
MCGILGSVGLDVRFQLSDLETLKHRGPDSYGFFEHEEIVLGHTRLSILDLSNNGSQPMFSIDRNYCIVFNGEIYNHLDLRNELQKLNYKFISESDTETILYSYIEWGDNFLKKLNGIFALAIFDKKNSNLFFARDQMGVKPFYYYLDSKNFSFSSELKSFNSINFIKKDISIEALFYYIQNLYTPNELTPFSNIKKLLPGNFGNYNIKTKFCKIEEFYTLDFNHELSNFTEYELINKLDELLNNAVKRQLLSDVPVGFFLSGGLDSSLLVAIAAKLIGPENINCFTIASGKNMIDEGFTDDEHYAKLIANKLKVSLNIINADSKIINSFDNIIWHLDEPQADPATIHVKNISKIAKSLGYKVLIGGTGGDDIFSGYRRHQAIYFEKYFNLLPFYFRKMASKVFNSLKIDNPFFRRLRKLFADISLNKNNRLVGYFMWYDRLSIIDLFKNEFKNSIFNNNLHNNHFINQYNKLPNYYSDLNKILYLEQTTFLPHHNLNYSDKMAMSEGVELRVPYLDLELVNFANHLPSKLKMKGFEAKYILKKVAERYLPNEIIYRKKTGFGSPVRAWVNKDLEPLINDRLLKDNHIFNIYFNIEKVKNLIKKTKDRKYDGSYTILSLLAIESWLRQNKK